MKDNIIGLLRQAQRHLALLDKVKNSEIAVEDLEDRYEVICAEEILQELIDKIKSGAKRQLIRADRKNPIKVGDKLYLYWKQRSPNDCEKLGETTCIRTTKITIERDCTKTEYLHTTEPELLDKFAVLDGFNNWQEMIEFFDQTHGLPFNGNLIEWDFPLKEVSHAHES